MWSLFLSRSSPGVIQGQSGDPGGGRFVYLLFLQERQLWDEVSMRLEGTTKRRPW